MKESVSHSNSTVENKMKLPSNMLAKLPRNPTTFAILPLILAVQSVTAIAQDRVIEEVIVTSQKRAQSVQDVSIAIAAFGEEELKALGVRNLEDLTEHVSGAELFDDRGAGQPT